MASESQWTNPLAELGQGDMKACLIQQSSATYKEMGDLCYERHRAYCNAHSFAFCNWRGKVLNRPDRGPTYCRLPLMQFALEMGYDYVVCIDADALIVRPEVDFRSAMPADKAFGMAQHPKPWEDRQWHWNCGVMVVRPGALKTIKDTIRMGNLKNSYWNEQGRINRIAQDEPWLFHKLDNKWNSAEHINPCPSPVVKAWHGLHLAALPLMKKEIGTL